MIKTTLDIMACVRVCWCVCVGGVGCGGGGGGGGGLLFVEAVISHRFTCTASYLINDCEATFLLRDFIRRFCCLSRLQLEVANYREVVSWCVHVCSCLYSVCCVCVCVFMVWQWRQWKIDMLRHYIIVLNCSL